MKFRGFGRNESLKEGVDNSMLTNIFKKISFSTFVQYAGKAVQLGISVISIKLITNFLSENAMGNYSAISEFALFISTAANLGIFGNVIRKMADEPSNGKIFGNALLLRVFTALLFFISAFIYLITTGCDRTFLMGSVVFMGALFLDYITSVCDGMLQANYMMGKATVALVVGKVVYVGLLFLLIKNVDATSDIAISFLFLPTLIGSIITAVLSVYFVSRKVPLVFKFDRAFCTQILLTSLPFGIINIVNNLYFRFLPSYLAYNNLNDAQYAAFSIAFKIAQVLSLLSTFLMFSVLPEFKRELDNKNFELAALIFRKVKTILLFCGIFITVFGSLIGPKLIELLTHKKYVMTDHWFVLPLMLLLCSISFWYDLVLITVFAFEKELEFLKNELIALLLAILCFIGLKFTNNDQVHLILILCGGIIAESYMVLSGFRIIGNYFKKNT